MNVPEETDEPAQINIVPMIDVIFAILTYFIMASLFLTRSEGLPVNLPKAATAQEQRQVKIAVTIDDKGKLFLNRRPVQLSQLADQVKALSARNPQSIVVLNADTAVKHGEVVAVMDKLRSLEGLRMGIATQPQSP